MNSFRKCHQLQVTGKDNPSAASYLYPINQGSAKSPLSVWYQAEIKVWPSTIPGVAEKTVQLVKQKLQYRVMSTFIATRNPSEGQSPSWLCYLLKSGFTIVFNGFFTLPLPVPLKCKAFGSERCHQILKQNLSSFVAFYGLLYQHMDTKILQSDIQQTAHLFEKKPYILPNGSFTGSFRLLFTLGPDMA